MPTQGQGADIVYTFSGDITELEQAMNRAESSMAEAGDEAKKTGKTIDSSLSKTSGSAKGAGKSLDDLGDAAGATDSKLKALAGAVGVVNPELGAALTAAGDLAGGFEVLTLGGASLLTVLLPVAVAVGALGAVYWKLSKDLEAAEAAEDRQIERVKKITEVSREANAIQLETQRINGEVTDYEAKLATIRAEAAAAIQDKTEAEREAVKVARDFLQDAKARVGATARVAEGEKELAKALEDVNDVVRGVQIVTDAKIEQAKAIEAARVKAEKAAKEAADQAEAASRADQARAKSAQEKAKADAEEAARVKAMVALSEKGYATLERIRDDANQTILASTTSLYDQLEALRQDDLEALKSAREDILANETLSSEERLEVESTYLEAKALLNEEHLLKLSGLEAEAEKVKDERREAEIKKNEEAQQARVQSYKKATDALESMASDFEEIQTNIIDRLETRLTDSGDTMTESERKNLEKRIKYHKKAASAAAVVQKAAGVVNVAISTGEAIMKALAQLGPIAGGVAAGVIGAAGALQAGVILSQPTEFHSGGMVSEAGPRASGPGDEVDIRALEDEAILTNRGVRTLGGPEAVREANLGRLANHYANNQADFRPFLQDHKRLSAEYSAETQDWSGRINPFS